MRVRCLNEFGNMPAVPFVWQVWAPALPNYNSFHLFFLLSYHVMVKGSLEACVSLVSHQAVRAAVVIIC